MRRMISRLFNRFAQIVLGLEFRDPMSGLIIARSNVFERARPNPIGFKVNLETFYKATDLGLKGAEVPIRFVPNTTGRSKAGVREAVRTLSYIITLRFRD